MRQFNLDSGRGSRAKAAKELAEKELAKAEPPAAPALRGE
jgi:hypothetical protein